MKKLITLLFVLFCFSGFGQVYQLMPQYGYQANRFRFDSTLQIPTVCGVPTLKSNVSNLGAIAFDSCNNRFYTYNPKTATWSQVSGGGGSTDTTSLSARINLKLDSVKRRSDSVFAYRNGTEVFQFKDSLSTVATKLVTSVYNATGTTIPKGSVVYINGRHSSNLPTVALAQANNEDNSYKTFALVENDIATSNSGTVIQAGSITGLNLPTSSFADGDIVFLSPTVAGGLTTTKPLAPYHICKIGSITRAHPTQGSIEIKIENGWQLDELSDVSIPLVPADSVVLQFSRVDSLWHDVTISNAIGTRYLKPTDTATMLTPYFRRSLSANDTIKTNGKVLQINAKTLTKNSSIKLDTIQVVIDAEQTNGGANLTLNGGQTSLTQIDGNYTNQMLMNTDGVNFLSTDGSTLGGLVVNSTIGTYWYSTANDTTGIFPRTKGSTGKILKLQNDKQLIWANDSIGTTIDTSAFQRKQLAAYSFQANGTGVAANSVATYFKDTSGTYTLTPTWSGGAPTGTTNHTYRFTRIGRMVNLTITLNYSTAGSSTTSMTVPFQSDFPTPSIPSGLSAANELLYVANVQFAANNNTTLANAAARSAIKKNSANNGFEITSGFAANVKTAMIHVSYYTD